MGELALAAALQNQALIDSSHRVSVQQRMDEEIDAANREHALKLAAVQSEAAALDKGAKDYENKLKAIHNKETQLVKAYENEVTAIRSKAEIERNQRILSASTQFNDAIAHGLTDVLMRHSSFAATMGSLGNQVAAGMLENAIKSILVADMTKEHEAAAAARKAYNIGLSIGGPAGFILGPVMAASAFAGVMAFQAGTDRVPGIGSGDTVPAMLAPGEGVVPGGVMDNLRKMASSGTMGGGTTVHLTHRPTYHVQTIDASGIKGVLTKHSEEFSRHFHNEIRKMNR